MRYSSNSDKSQFQAFKLEGKKRVKVAVIYMILLDVRRHWFGKGKYSAIGYMVSSTDNATDEDLLTIQRDLPRLKRQRLDFVLEQLDRYLLEAQMLVTGHTTHKKFECDTVDIGDIQPEDLKHYASALKYRATVLSNAMVKKADKAKQPGKKALRVCHSILIDGTNEYSKNGLFY